MTKKKQGQEGNSGKKGGSSGKKGKPREIEEKKVRSSDFRGPIGDLCNVPLMIVNLHLIYI